MWCLLWKKSATQKLLREVKTTLKKYGYECHQATRVRLNQVAKITDLSGETIALKSTYLIRRQRAVVYLLDTKSEDCFVFKALGATEGLIVKTSDDLETLEAELLADSVLGTLNQLGLLNDSQE